MRWLRWPISTVIVLLLPVWFLLLIPKLNGFGPENLKQELKQQQTYEQLSTILHQEQDQPESGQAEVTDQALIVLRGALTADYIEAKSNKAIDDTSQWITKQSDKEPTLELNDIKEQVLTAYPDAQTQISQLQADLAEARDKIKDQPQPVDGVEGLDSDGTASTDEIAKLLQQSGSLDNFISGDFTINLGQVFKPLYQFYQYYQIAIPVIAIFIGLLLVGFIFSSNGWQSRCKYLGWLFLVASVVNGILVAVFSLVVLQFGLATAIAMLPEQAEVVGSIGQAVIQSLFANYLQIELIISIALFVIGLLLILMPRFIGKNQSNVAPSIGSTNTQDDSATVTPTTIPPKS